MGNQLTIEGPIPFFKENVSSLKDNLFGVYLILVGEELLYSKIGSGLIKSELQKHLGKIHGSHFVYVETERDKVSATKKELLQFYKKWPPETQYGGDNH
jgi:hypothetical protein